VILASVIRNSITLDGAKEEKSGRYNFQIPLGGSGFFLFRKGLAKA
jgi:hypothetical protein